MFFKPIQNVLEADSVDIGEVLSCLQVFLSCYHVLNYFHFFHQTSFAITNKIKTLYHKMSPLPCVVHCWGDRGY